MALETPMGKHLRREQLWRVMHDGHGRAGHVFNFLLVALIIVSLSILPLEFAPQFSAYRTTLSVLEIILTSLFTVEYALRVFASPNRLRYVFSFYGLVDLFSILPFYAGLLGTQYIRGLRLVRLVRLGEIEPSAVEEDAQSMQESIGIVSGQAVQETIEYVVSRHPIYLIIGCLPPLFATTGALAVLLFVPLNAVSLTIAATLLLFALLLLWRTWLDFSYDVIYVTSHRMICQNQHLFGRSINQINYFAITNVKPYYPGLFSYLFGYGSLVIETAADQPGHIEMHMVRDHEKAAHKIMQKCFEVGAKVRG